MVININHRENLLYFIRARNNSIVMINDGLLNAYKYVECSFEMCVCVCVKKLVIIDIFSS